MKANHKYLYLAFSLAAIIPIAMLAMQSKRPKNNGNSDHENKSVQKQQGSLGDTARKSITFILGEDEKGAKPYYSLAYDYYTTDKQARTEVINNACRSLSEVRDYLKDNPPGNGRPWGLVNLVSHGNDWYGMTVPVIPGSKRSSATRIAEYIEEGKFEPVADNIVDDSTEIFLHSCGVGNDKELLDILSIAFGGKENRPMVLASKLKEYYFSVQTSNRMMKSQLYYAKTWKVYYPFKERPDNEALKNELIQHYPNEQMDWDNALRYTNPAVPGDVFHYEVNIPVYYTVKYDNKKELPDLSTQEKKLKFISSQKMFAGLITKSKIPFGKFTWSTQKIYVTDDDNNKKPAISITGWCTVLCVVQPLTEIENKDSWMARPYFPEKTDTTYFGMS